MTKRRDFIKKSVLSSAGLAIGSIGLSCKRNNSTEDSRVRVSLQETQKKISEALSAASDSFTQDIAIMAKHIPNISVAGYWWHTMYPFYIRKSLETRLDIVPVNKIIAFFSDAYRCEWCWPKLRLVKQIMGEVLVDRVA